MSHEEYQEVTGVYPDLGLHTSGEWVSYAQQKLVEAGYLEPNRADGLLGPHTEEMLRRFQAAHGLAADGIIGQHTWAALDAVGAAPPAAEHHAEPPAGDPHGAPGPAEAHTGEPGHGGSPHRTEVGVLRFASLPSIAASDGALVWTVYNAGPGIVPRGSEGGFWRLYQNQQPIGYSRDHVRTERDLRPNEHHEEFGVGVKFETPDNGDYQAGVTLGEETHYVAYRMANGRAYLLG